MKVQYDMFFDILDEKMPSRKQLMDVILSVERDRDDPNLGVLGDLRFRINSAKVADFTTLDLNRFTDHTLPTISANDREITTQFDINAIDDIHTTSSEVVDDLFTTATVSVTSNDNTILTKEPTHFGITDSSEIATSATMAWGRKAYDGQNRNESKSNTPTVKTEANVDTQTHKGADQFGSVLNATSKQNIHTSYSTDGDTLPTTDKESNTNTAQNSRKKSMKDFATKAVNKIQHREAVGRNGRIKAQYNSRLGNLLNDVNHSSTVKTNTPNKSPIDKDTILSNNPTTHSDVGRHVTTQRIPIGNHLTTDQHFTQGSIEHPTTTQSADIVGSTESRESGHVNAAGVGIPTNTSNSHDIKVLTFLNETILNITELMANSLQDTTHTVNQTTVTFVDTTTASSDKSFKEMRSAINAGMVTNDYTVGSLNHLSNTDNDARRLFGETSTGSFTTSQHMGSYIEPLSNTSTIITVGKVSNTFKPPGSKSTGSLYGTQVTSTSGSETTSAHTLSVEDITTNVNQRFNFSNDTLYNVTNMDDALRAASISRGQTTVVSNLLDVTNTSSNFDSIRNGSLGQGGINETLIDDQAMNEAYRVSFNNFWPMIVDKTKELNTQTDIPTTVYPYNTSTSFDMNINISTKGVTRETMFWDNMTSNSPVLADEMTVSTISNLFGSVSMENSTEGSVLGNDVSGTESQSRVFVGTVSDVPIVVGSTVMAKDSLLNSIGNGNVTDVYITGAVVPNKELHRTDTLHTVVNNTHSDNQISFNESTVSTHMNTMDSVRRGIVTDKAVLGNRIKLIEVNTEEKHFNSSDVRFANTILVDPIGNMSVDDFLGLNKNGGTGTLASDKQIADHGNSFSNRSATQEYVNSNVKDTVSRFISTNAINRFTVMTKHFSHTTPRPVTRLFVEELTTQTKADSMTDNNLIFNNVMDSTTGMNYVNTENISSNDANGSLTNTHTTADMSNNDSLNGGTGELIVNRTVSLVTPIVSQASRNGTTITRYNPGFIVSSASADLSDIPSSNFNFTDLTKSPITFNTDGGNTQASSSVSSFDISNDTSTVNALGIQLTPESMSTPISPSDGFVTASTLPAFSSDESIDFESGRIRTSNVTIQSKQMVTANGEVTQSSNVFNGLNMLYITPFPDTPPPRTRGINIPTFARSAPRGISNAQTDNVLTSLDINTTNMTHLNGTNSLTRVSLLSGPRSITGYPSVTQEDSESKEVTSFTSMLTNKSNPDNETARVNKTSDTHSTTRTKLYGFDSTSGGVTEEATSKEITKYTSESATSSSEESSSRDMDISSFTSLVTKDPYMYSTAAMVRRTNTLLRTFSIAGKNGKRRDRFQTSTSPFELGNGLSTSMDAFSLELTTTSILPNLPKTSKSVDAKSSQAKNDPNGGKFAFNLPQPTNLFGETNFLSPWLPSKRFNIPLQKPGATMSSTPKEIVIARVASTPKPGFNYLWSLGGDVLSSLFKETGIINQPDTKWKDNRFSSDKNAVVSPRIATAASNAKFQSIHEGQIKPKETFDAFALGGRPGVPFQGLFAPRTVFSNALGGKSSNISNKTKTSKSVMKQNGTKTTS